MMIREAFEFLIKLAVVMFLIGMVVGFYLGAHYVTVGGT